VLVDDIYSPILDFYAWV